MNKKTTFIDKIITKIVIIGMCFVLISICYDLDKKLNKTTPRKSNKGDSLLFLIIFLWLLFLTLKIYGF